MKNLILSLILVASVIAAFGQAGSLSQSVYRSRVNDSTSITTPSGYGLLYYNNQRATPKWIFSNDEGTTWQELGSGSNSLTTISSSVFMFSGINSDLTGYESATSLSDYTPAALSTSGTTVTTTPTLIEEFATASGQPGVTAIPIGIINVHYDIQKSAGSNNYYSYAEVYKRVLAGTETLLGTTDISSQSAVNTVLQTNVSLALTNPVFLLSTDRIIVKVYGVMLSSSATITLNYDDNTNARVEIPVNIVSGGGGSFTLTNGELTTVGGDLTSVNVGGTASANVDMNLNTHELYIHGGTYNTIEGSNEQILKNTASTAQVKISPVSGIEVDGGTQSATLKGPIIILEDNGDVGGSLDFLKSDGAGAAVWGTINADDLSTLTDTRTITSSDDLDQTDNLRIVYTDCAAPCNVTVDLLSTGTQVTVINNGASTATLTEGSGVTLTGTTIPIATGESALIIYKTAATPDVYVSTSSAGSGGLTVGTSTITSGTSGNFLYNNAGVLGERTPGAGVATWFQTPSYTNFLAAITGTSPYYLTGSGGTATASNTKTFNTANWDNTTSTWTATANSQFASNETGTLTARGTASDILYGRTSSRTFVAAANTQELTDTYINPTFTVGAFTGTVRVGLHINAGSLFVGSGINSANIKAGFRGWGNTNTTSVADFKDLAGSSIFTIGDGGTIVVRPAALLQFGGANDYISSGTANSLTFSTNSGNLTTGAYRFRWGGSSNTGGGIIPNVVVESTGSVNPTSGATTFPSVYVITPYNATGTATSKGISFYSAPVITALPTLTGFKHEPTNPSNISGDNIAFHAVTGQSLLTGGSLSLAYVAKTANYTLTSADYLVNCTANSFTTTLPTAVGITGRVYIIKNTGAGTITLASTSSQTIDGAAPGTLAAGPTVIRLMSDGANWISF